MKDFPEEYECEKLDEMYAALGLPEEQLQLLKDYFDAFCRFYYRISLRDAYDILKRHNGDLISCDTFIAFSEVVRHEESRTCNYLILGEDELYEDVDDTQPIDREIVAEHLVMYDDGDYDRFVAVQSRKPFYVPGKEEFLKYSDDFYYERTPQLEVLEDFLIEKAGIAKDKAVDIIDECAMCITAAAFPYEDITEAIENDIFIWRFPFTNFQREEFMRLACDAANNLRHPCNRGFTPNELAERYGLLGGDTVASLYAENKEFTLSEVGYSIYIPRGVAVRGKVGRNDPCPCGSGKKYKKCCMRSGKYEFD